MPPLQVAPRERGPRSLKRMALAVALRNISSIQDLGDMAFADARPLLMHMENPEQLHLIEQRCPQLAAESAQMAVVWRRLLNKKLSHWETAEGLDAFGFSEDGIDGAADADVAWFEVYRTAKAAHDRDIAAATARLQKTLAGFDKAKEDNATQLVTSRATSRALLQKMPGVGVKRRQRNVGPGGGSAGTSVLSFGAGSRSKMTSGQAVLRRARREARELSNKVSNLSAPTGQQDPRAAAAARSQIRHAPAAMMNDYRVAHQPEIVMIRAPGRRRSTTSSSALSPGSHCVPGTGLGQGNVANEARLLALKAGGGAAPSIDVASITTARKRLDVSEAKAVETNTLRESHRLASKTYGERSWSDDDDDDLFGTVPSKKPRLTVEDLENLGSKRTAKRTQDATGVPSPARKLAGSMARPAGIVRKSPAQKTVSDKPADTREWQSRTTSAAAPSDPKLVARSAAQLAARPTQPLAASSPSGPHSKKGKGVDIFMRPRRR